MPETVYVCADSLAVVFWGTVLGVLAGAVVVGCAVYAATRG